MSNSQLKWWENIPDAMRGVLDALGDRWMVRNDDHGVSYGGYQCAAIGDWNTCPKWSAQTRSDCESGGFFGQGPGGFGFVKHARRFTFCEFDGPRIVVDDDKIKVRKYRVIYVGQEALLALFYVGSGKFAGSLYLSGTTLPEGFTLGDVGGSLDLRGTTLPEGFTLGDVGGSLYLRGTTLANGKRATRSNINRARA